VAFGIVLAAGVSVGQEDPAIPKDVQEMMGYLAGFWRFEGTIEGTDVQGTMSVRWSPGKHCQIYNGRLWEKGDRQNALHITVLCGYDAANDQAVETAYWSDGSHALSRYNMTPRIVDKGVIEGQRSGIFAGEDLGGTIKAERKGPDQFDWTASQKDGGTVKLQFQRVESPQRREKPQK
jgi:hypothetical protein